MHHIQHPHINPIQSISIIVGCIIIFSVSLIIRNRFDILVWLGVLVAILVGLFMMAGSALIEFVVKSSDSN